MATMWVSVMFVLAILRNDAVYKTRHPEEEHPRGQGMQKASMPRREDLPLFYFVVGCSRGYQLGC